MPPEARERQSSARRRAENHKAFDKTTLRVPDGASLFQLGKAGTKRIDVIPYKVGKGNPFADEGSIHYERTFWTHRGIGPNNDSYVCPAKTAGKKCPICDHRAKLAKDPNADEDLIKDLAPKERQLFQIIDLGDREKGMQLWECSYHLFGKQLDKEVKNGDDGEYDFFYEVKDGLTLKIGVEEKSFAGVSFSAVETIGFKPRSETYDKSIMAETHCLDDLLDIKPYDELKAIFLQQDADDDDEPPPKKKPAAADDDDDDAPPPKKKPKPAADEDDDAPPPKKKPAPADDDDDEPPPKKKPAKKKPAPADDDDDEPPPKKKPATAQSAGIEVGDAVEYNGERCTVAKISGDGTSLKLLDSDDERVPDAVGVADVKLLKKKKPKAEAAEEETPPPKKAPTGSGAGAGGTGKGKPSAQSANDDDDDDAPPPKKKPKPAPADDDDDDAPPPKKKPKPAADEDDTGDGKWDNWDDDEDETPAPKKKPKPAADDDED